METQLASRPAPPRAGSFPRILVPAFSAYYARKRLLISPEDWNRIAFGRRVDSLVEPGAPVIFVDVSTPSVTKEFRQHRTAQGEYLGCYPLDFYFSHRKGWSLDENLATPSFIETLHQRGARYFASFFPTILVRHPDLKAALDRSYTPVEITPQWVIYRLSAPTSVMSRAVKLDAPER